MKTVLITGGTGLVGTALTRLLLSHGYQVIILTRNPLKYNARGAFGNQVSYAAWNVAANTIDITAVQQADYIIHLAGAGVVDKRWTTAYKKEIVDSRVNSTALLLNTLKSNSHQVKAFISSSATGWYGADTAASSKTGFTEDAPAAADFLGETCKLWEASSEPLTQMGIRRVCLRTGIVLDKEGGAFAEFKKPIKLGIAAILGNGKQMVSWIAISDLCSMFLFAMENESIAGSYNAVAPNPVTNAELTIAIARGIKGKAFLKMHVPNFILKMMLGESSIEILKSATVSCAKIQMAGYQFGLPTIEKAVTALVNE